MAEPATLSSSKPSLMLAGKYDVEVEEVLDQILTSATCTVTNFTHTILFKSQSQSNLSNTLQYLNHHSHSIFFIVDCNRHTSAACTIIGLACAYNLQISISVSMSLYPLLIVLDLVAIIPVVQKQHQFLVTLPLYNVTTMDSRSGGLSNKIIIELIGRTKLPMVYYMMALLEGGGIETLYLVDVLISNLTFLGSPFWNIHPIYCSFLMVEKTRLWLALLTLISLPDEIAGTKPELNEPDITRVYISNVCIAEQLHRNGSNGNFVLELDFEPFNTSFPRPTLKKSIGNGVEFLNGHLSAKLFHGKESMQPLLEFVRLHSYNEKTFFGRIPMVFNVVILSPHGYFAQDNVLGYPNTGGQVVYILDQVRALENEMLNRIKKQGLDITPRILIVSPLCQM
ncbi:Sucrose synthase [Arachis hypogaea]|nr:Sucrose synthase [Arachis hypogaea]